MTPAQTISYVAEGRRLRKDIDGIQNACWGLVGGKTKDLSGHYISVSKADYNKLKKFFTWQHGMSPMKITLYGVRIEPEEQDDQPPCLKS